MTAGGGVAVAPPLLVVVEHAEDEGPGLIADVAAGFGMNVQRIGSHQPLPTALDAVTALLVMGGPQSAYLGDARLRAEVALLHEAVTCGLPTLGICLGAQLLAVACGAEVHPGDRGQELGLGSVSLTAPGRDDPLFAECAGDVPVLHAHGDTFALPRGSCHLASSDLYPGQAFRLGRAYGFQFHIEMDEGLLAAWSQRLGLPAVALQWLRSTHTVRRAIVGNWVAQALDAVP